MTYPRDMQALEDLDDWKVEDGEVDPRGLALIGAGNQKLGTIRTLLASPTTQKAHFAIVKPDGAAGKEFAIPLDNVRFDSAHNRAFTPYLMAQFTDAPAYTAGVHDYDQYHTYWTGALKNEPTKEEDQFSDQHRDFNDVVRLREGQPRL